MADDTRPIIGQPEFDAEHLDRDDPTFDACIRTSRPAGTQSSSI